MKSFSNNTLCFSLQKVLGLLHFGSCQNCMNSANLVPEIHQKICNKRGLSTEEPCSCKYATLLQSFHRGTLSIPWYKGQNFQLTFSISILFRYSFKTAIFSRFFKQINIINVNMIKKLQNCKFKSKKFMSGFSKFINKVTKERFLASIYMIYTLYTYIRSIYVLCPGGCLCAVISQNYWSSVVQALASQSSF